MSVIHKFVEDCKNKLQQGGKVAITCGAKVIVVYHDEEYRDLFDIHIYKNGKIVGNSLGIHKDDLRQEMVNIEKVKPVEN